MFIVNVSLVCDNEIIRNEVKMINLRLDKLMFISEAITQQTNTFQLNKNDICIENICISFYFRFLPHDSFVYIHHFNICFIYFFIFIVVDSFLLRNYYAYY